VSDAGRAEEARAGLVAAGSLAVPALLGALDEDNDRVRLRAIGLLALLGDRRAVAPVISLLHDPLPSVRLQAAGALARLNTGASVPALSRLLDREQHGSVRLVTVRSLVRLVQTGHEEALSPLLDCLSDRSEEPRIRCAALEGLGWIADPDQQAPARALLSRLADDPDPDVARKARRILKAPSAGRLESWALERLLEDLASPRLAIWRRAVALLGRSGGPAVDPIVQRMLARADDREFARRAVLTLRGLSPRQLARIGPYLEEIDQPVPLEALVDLAAAAGGAALLGRLAGVIERAAARGREGGGRWLAVRARAHLALARAGSRLAADDLRRLLQEPQLPLLPEVVEAAGRIGTRRDIPALVRAYRRSRGIDRLAAREAVFEVVRRERIRRTDRCLVQLDGQERRAAREILGSCAGSVRRRGAPLKRTAPAPDGATRDGA
jgi:HEAT repeat protein